jgi:uncharacterized protein YfiM (DUF2279 family)
VGPLPIKVVRVLNLKEIEDKGTLFLLTKNRLIYFADATNAPTVLAARKKEYLRIDSRDGKILWSLDSNEGQFSGLGIKTEPLGLRGQSLDREAENRYLFFALERLQEQLDHAILLEDSSTVASCLKAAAAFVALMREKGLDAGLLEEFETLEAYSKSQEELFRRGRELFQAAFLDLTAYKRDEALDQGRREARKMMGSLQICMAFSSQTGFYSREASPSLIAEALAIDSAGCRSGINRLLVSQLTYAQQECRLQAAKSLFSQRLAGQFEDLQKQFNDQRKERSRAARAYGVRRFRLPKSHLADQREEWNEFVRKGKDLSAIVEVLTNQAKELRAESASDFALTLIEIYAVKSRLPKADVKKGAEEIFALAEQCVAAAKRVPEEPAYQRHRWEILRTAAGLAMQAALLETGERAWTDAYSSKALYAVRLFDSMRTLNVGDIDGDFRELRAYGLLMSGRPDDALQQAVEVDDLHKRSAVYHYNLARIYCAQNNLKDALRSLDEALKKGSFDLGAVRDTTDFAPIKKDKRFAALTAVNADAQVEFAQRGFFGQPQQGNTLEITNRSSFALTNVKLQLDIRVFNSNYTYKHELADPLLPGATYRWNNAFAFDASQRPTGSLLIKCDQGKATVAPTAK